MHRLVTMATFVGIICLSTLSPTYGSPLETYEGKQSSNSFSQAWGSLTSASEMAHSSIDELSKIDNAELRTAGALLGGEIKMSAITTGNLMETIVFFLEAYYRLEPGTGARLKLAPIILERSRSTLNLLKVIHQRHISIGKTLKYIKSPRLQVAHEDLVRGLSEANSVLSKSLDGLKNALKNIQ